MAVPSGYIPLESWLKKYQPGTSFESTGAIAGDSFLPDKMMEGSPWQMSTMPVPPGGDIGQPVAPGSGEELMPSFERTTPGGVTAFSLDPPSPSGSPAPSAFSLDSPSSSDLAPSGGGTLSSDLTPSGSGGTPDFMKYLGQTGTPDISNTYWDPAQRKKSSEQFGKTMQPRTTEAMNRLLTSVGPMAGGERAKKMTSGVINPINQKILDFEMGLEGKGYDFAADLPFKLAGYTGKLGGSPTIPGMQAASGLASAQQQREYMPKQFGLQESQVSGYMPEGGDTLQRHMYENMSPYQESLVAATEKDTELEALKSIMNAMGLVDWGSGIGDWLGGIGA